MSDRGPCPSCATCTQALIACTPERCQSCWNLEKCPGIPAKTETAVTDSECRCDCSLCEGEECCKTHREPVPTGPALVHEPPFEQLETVEFRGVEVPVTDPETPEAPLEELARDYADLVAAQTRGVLEELAQAPTETVLEEAQRLVYGPRQASYGHPFDDFTKTGQMWGAILSSWRDSAEVAVPPELVALCQIAVKISREVNAPKRDNVVDMAGYAGTLALVRERQAQ